MLKAINQRKANPPKTRKSLLILITLKLREFDMGNNFKWCNILKIKGIITYNKIIGTNINNVKIVVIQKCISCTSEIFQRIAS